MSLPLPSQDDPAWALPVTLIGVGHRVFAPHHVRKSSQWVALTRAHAEFVARERELLWEVLYMDTSREELKKRCVWDLA